jgi:hypothetical protein
MGTHRRRKELFVVSLYATCNPIINSYDAIGVGTDDDGWITGWCG